MKKYASPLRLEVSSSIQLVVLLFLLHLASFVLLFFVPIPLEFLIPSGLFIIASGIYTLKFHALKSLSSSIVNIIWAEDDEWHLIDRKGNKTEVSLDGNSYIHPWCSVLVFKQQNRFLSKSVVLLSDNINKNDFRRLRVRLKIHNSVVNDE